MSIKAFDEMNGFDGETRAAYRSVKAWLDNTPPDLLEQRRLEAEALFRRFGITFAVYGAKDAEERLIPFDIIPRVLTAKEWSALEQGLVQRVEAINALIVDLYGKREIIRAGILPEELVFSNEAFRPEMIGVNVPGGVPVPIAGIDLVRIDEDEFYVLEDNARTPSGVSYMLDNREATHLLFPDLVASSRVRPVERYADELLAALKSLAPRASAYDPTIVVLTPGPYNSAFYEHSFLADKLGVDLVEGRDLFVEDDVLFMRTTRGPRRVDVVYRRIDDDFLDPLAFRPTACSACRACSRATAPAMSRWPTRWERA